MKVAIHQPHYLPWTGYLAKWAAADCFIFLDTVQYEKNGWQNRNRIKTKDGPQWLTVPVHRERDTLIRDVRIDARQPWARRHMQAVRLAYARAAHAEEYGARLGALLEREWTTLAALSVATAEFLAGAFGISTVARLASELPPTRDDPTLRLIDLTRAAGGDIYLAGQDALAYARVEDFARAGIRILRQTYAHPVYAQLHGEFVPFLSALDLLLTHGPGGLAILRGGDAYVACA
jgi:WbqC-like protein family